MTQPSIAAEQHRRYSEARERLYGPTPVARVQRSLIPAEGAVPPRPPRAKALRPQRLEWSSTGTHSSGRVWRKASADKIMSEVAEKHGVTVDEIKGHERKTKFKDARFEVYYRLKMELDYSSAMTADATGGKDPTSVLHGIKRHTAMLEKSA